jgi:hypothetical protein
MAPGQFAGLPDQSPIEALFMPHPDTSFWKRWSLLKRQAEAPAGEPSPAADSGSAKLPDLDTLRVLFRQPEFAGRDGLDDYDGDYTAFEPRGEFLTCDMRWALERARPAETCPEPAPVATGEAFPPPPPVKETLG